MTMYITDKRTANCIRGIAAIFIMIGHLCGDMPTWFRYLFSGEMWVGVFFFYSGYGLNYSYSHNPSYLDGFIWKKLKTIYLPFFIVETLYTVSYSLRVEQLSITDIILGCLGIRLYNSVLWYVIELLAINLLFCLWHRLYKGQRDDWIWIVLYVIFLGVGVACDIGTWWYISTSAYILGIYWTRVREHLQIYEKNRILQILLVVAYVAIYGIYKSLSLGTYVPTDTPFHMPVNYIITAMALVLVPAFVLVVMTVTYWCKSLIVGRITEVLGSISYEIYLYHLLIGMYVTIGGISTAIKLLIIVILTIIVAWIAHSTYNRLTGRARQTTIR